MLGLDYYVPELLYLRTEVIELNSQFIKMSIAVL